MDRNHQENIEIKKKTFTYTHTWFLCLKSKELWQHVVHQIGQILAHSRDGWSYGPNGLMPDPAWRLCQSRPNYTNGRGILGALGISWHILAWQLRPSHSSYHPVQLVRWIHLVLKRPTKGHMPITVPSQCHHVAMYINIYQCTGNANMLWLRLTLFDSMAAVAKRLRAEAKMTSSAVHPAFNSQANWMQTEYRISSQTTAAKLQSRSALAISLKSNWESRISHHFSLVYFHLLILVMPHLNFIEQKCLKLVKFVKEQGRQHPVL